MLAHDRRFGVRVPLEILLDQYRGERRSRGMTSNISETGCFIATPAAATGLETHAERVALELALPGIDETIWACAEIRYRRPGQLVCGQGIRFVAMARAHARMLRDFCVERRRDHLSSLLSRIRR